MATKVFVLIETAVGRTKEVANTIRKVEAIRSADVVTGPFDVIAVIEAPDINAMGQVLEREIHAVNGVVRTVTCVAITS